MTTTARHFEVFIVSKTNGQTTYLPAGRARENRDGSLNVYLESLPISGQLHLRPPATPPADLRIPVAPATSTLNMKPAPHTVVFPLFTGDVLNGWAHQCPGKRPDQVQANELNVVTCICGQIRPSLDVLHDLHAEARRSVGATCPGKLTSESMPPKKCDLKAGHPGKHVYRVAGDGPDVTWSDEPYVPPESPAHCTKDQKCWKRHGHEGDCDTELPF